MKAREVIDVLALAAFFCLLIYLLTACGGTTNAEPGAACFAGSMEHTFDFASSGALVEESELVHTSGARVWSVRLALTMLSPVEMPAGDNVACFYTLDTGAIRSREFLDNTNFEPVPLANGAAQSVAELVVDVPADEVLVGARLQYNAHVAGTYTVRVDAEACSER